MYIMFYVYVSYNILKKNTHTVNSTKVDIAELFSLLLTKKAPELKMFAYIIWFLTHQRHRSHQLLILLMIYVTVISSRLSRGCCYFQICAVNLY